MSRFSFVVIAAFAVLALANPDVNLDLQVDVNLTDAEDNFGFRYTSASKTDVGLIVSQMCQAILSGKCDFLNNVYIWSSTSVKVELAQTASGNIDSMLALGFPPTQYIFPFSIFAYAKGKAALSVTPLAYLSNILLNATGSYNGGAVAMAALTLEEFTPDGKPVPNTLITLNSNECSPKELHSGDNAVTGMSCVMSLKNRRNDGCKVTVTYVTTDTAGILKYGNTPVSPRSIDMIIEVENFPLTDDKNHARLNLGLGTATADADLEGNARIMVKDGEKVYVAASSHAVLGDGKVIDVDVNLESGSVPYELEAVFNYIAKLALGANYDLQIAHVDFPAGTKSFSTILPVVLVPPSTRLVQALPPSPFSPFSSALCSSCSKRE